MAESDNNREVAALMELIDKKQYDKAVERLSAIAQQVGSQEHGSVDELDLERLQLEPTKPFKKLRKLMTSDKGVQAVLSLLQTASSQKLEGLLRTLMIVVSVPEFAEKMVAGGITEALDEFCKALTPRVMSPLSLPGESELVWELPKLCLQLFNNSSMFFRSALLCGLLKHFTRFFPHVAQRFGDILNTPFRSEGLAEAYLRHSILPVIRLVHRFLSPPELARDTLLDPGFRSELGAWLVTMFRHLKLSVPFLEMFPRLEAAWNECFDELFGAWRESHIILALPKAETRDHIPSIRELLSNLKGSKRGEVSALLTLYETGPLSGPESIPRESAAGMLKEVEQHFRNLKEASESTRKQTLRQLERLFPVILGACFNGPMEEQTLNLFKAWVPEALSHVFLDGGSISRSSSEPLFALSLLDFVLQGAALIGEASPELCDTVGLRILQWAQREMAGSDCFGPILGSLLKVLITCFRSGEELQSKGEELLELITILLPRLRDPGPRPLGTQEIRVMLAASTVAWHFVAILIGYMEVESIASLLDSCAPAPVSLRAALGPRIVEPVVRQPRVNVRWSRLTGEAAKEAFADVDWLLSSTLVSAYTVLSELLRAKELSEQDQAKATTWTHFCATLIKVLEIVCRLRAAQGREEEMRQEMARAGMVAMCAKFVGDQRGGYHQSAILPSDSGDWLERLKVILDGLWKEFAKELKLKSCSNLGCTKGVYETGMNTFKRCSACSQVQYCSRECQKVHWKSEHKGACVKVKGAKS